MKNLYLNIIKRETGEFEIQSWDGVFSSSAIKNNKSELDAYCDEKAKLWIESKYGNFAGWKQSNRQIIADKWIKAKDLTEGEHKHYFFLGDVHKLFRQEVENLAKELGIKYTLTIH